MTFYLYPLFIAAKDGHSEMVIFLLEQGAEIEPVGIGNTSLHHAVKNVEIVDILLKAGANIKAQTTYTGENALHIAAREGCLALCKLLVERKIDLNAKDRMGHTALHSAIVAKHMHIIEYFISVGAHLQAQNGVLLEIAINTGNIECAKLLIEQGADVNARSSQGTTPLHFAASKGLPEIVALLLNKGAQLHVQDREQCTPLHLAVLNGDHDEVVKLLLEAGASKDTIDKDGNTPLHVAFGQVYQLPALAKSTKLKCVKLLVEQQANLEIKNNKGHAPLHIAAIKGEKELVKLLLENGANHKALTNKGELATTLAYQYKHASIVTLISEHRQKIKTEALKATKEIEMLKQTIHQQQAIIYALIDQMQILTSQLGSKAFKSDETQQQVVSQLSSFCQRLAKEITQENNNNMSQSGPKR